MMSKIPKRRLRAVAIFVIFLALAYSGFTALKQKEKAPNYTEMFKESSRTFTDYKSLNKAQMRVSSLNMGNALKEMNGIVNGYSLEKPLLKSRESSHGAYIFKIEAQRLPELMNKFNALGTIEGHKEIVDSALVVKSLATEEEILSSKRRELAELEALGQTYGNLGDRKEFLIGQIREQENRVNVLRQSNTTLLYVQMVPTMGGNSISTVRFFIFTFFIALLVLFVAVVLAYYGTKLIMYLLSMMGVKGFNASNLGGGYQYGYGNYANRYYSHYGYGGSKRKVKRIYKDKHGKRHVSGDDADEGGDEESN